MAVKSKNSVKIALVYALILALTASVFLYRLPVPDSAVALAAATFAPRSTPLTADAPGTRRVSLPDDWRDRDVPGRDGWYRMTVDFEEPVVALWAVLLPTVRMNAEVFVNGQSIGNGGRFDDPVARHLRQPLLFNVPNGLLRAGTNRIDVRVRAGPDGVGFLGPVYLGPEADLRRAFRLHYGVRITSVKVITLLITIVGLAVGVLAALRRTEREYLYFSLGVLIWAVHSLSYFSVRIPVSDRAWDWLMFSTLGYFAVVGGIVYVHRYLGLRFARAERAAVVACVALTLLMAVLPEKTFYRFAYLVWHPLCQGVAFYGLLRMTLAAWQDRRIELHVIAASGIMLCLFATHDLGLVFGLGDWSDGYYIQYSMPLIVGLFCAVLLHRFVRSVDEAEALNRDLERLVRDKTLEIERSHRRLRELEAQKAVAAERERIMMDMHDGIGGQLVSALALVDKNTVPVQQVEQTLRSALQDLRLMIDSLDAGGEEIDTILGMFRGRIEHGLNAAGIALQWDIRAGDGSMTLNASEALHVLRILQEAFTNVMRHSGATQVRLRTVDVDDDYVDVIVTDNGAGMARDARNGHGLYNMQRRADAIGAHLSLSSSPAGTRVRLRLGSGARRRQKASGSA